MATKSAASTPAFAYGADPESVQANERWQQAYDQLLQAVEARQEKPMFDPFWLKVAEAGSAPTRTGSYFETLGNTAGAIGKFQEEEQAKKEDIAQKRLELAGMGLQQANQRAALREYQNAAAPQAGQAAQANQSPSNAVLSSMGIEERGIPMFPPIPLPTKQRFMAGQVAKGVNPIDAEMAYQELLAKDIQVTANGIVIQKSTGMGFEIPDPTPIDVPFLTLQGETFKVPKTQARKLDSLTSQGDTAGRIALENKIRGVPTAPQAAPQAAPPAAPPSLAQPPEQQPVAPPNAAPSLQATPSAVQAPIVRSAQLPAEPPVVRTPAAPPVAPPAAPTVVPSGAGMQPASVLKTREAEAEKARAIAQAIAIEEGKAKVAAQTKREEENVADERGTIIDLKTKARAQANIADQVAKIATDYPNSMGTTAKPGPLAAGIKLLESGASIGGESAKASALENAYQTLTGTQEEISARRVLMGLAAEYLFNLRALTKGQGTITDYETRVLESIGPSLGDDAKSARFKAHIMKMHAEGEIDRVNAYQDWKKSPENKSLGWRDFLGSKESDRFAKDYNAKLDKAYDAFLGRKNPIGPPPQAAKPAEPSKEKRAFDFARSL